MVVQADLSEIKIIPMLFGVGIIFATKYKDSGCKRGKNMLQYKVAYLKIRKNSHTNKKIETMERT